MESQFWGVVLQPEKMYEQTVESSFHVSMGTIETSSLGDKPTSVFVETGGEEYLLCSLNASHLNAHLDLNFIEGEKIGFRASGPSTIHLTGYLIPDSDDMIDNFEESESSEEEDLEEAPPLVNGKNSKRKSEDSPSVPSKKSKKELALARANKVLEEYAAKKKKQKIGDDADDDTSDDGILDFTDNYAEEEDSEEVDSDSGEEEEDLEDDDDEEEMESSPSPKKVSEKAKKQQQPSTPSTPKNKNKTPDSATKKETPKSPKASKTFFNNGVQCEELKQGTGPDVKKGKVIGMYYDGRLKSNNKRFDATLTGKPFRFRLGAGEVIKGWDLGLEGMKVGGKRRLTIPPKFAYGARGAPPDIPPNSSLVFEVECKFVK